MEGLTWLPTLDTFWSSVSLQFQTSLCLHLTPVNTFNKHRTLYAQAKRNQSTSNSILACSQRCFSELPVNKDIVVYVTSESSPSVIVTEDQNKQCNGEEKLAMPGIHLPIHLLIWYKWSDNHSDHQSPLPYYLPLPIPWPDQRPSLVSGFLLQWLLFFEMQPQLYPTDRAKIGYIISLLSGIVLQWANSIWEASGPVTNSLAALSICRMRSVRDRFWTVSVCTVGMKDINYHSVQFDHNAQQWVQLSYYPWLHL